MKTRLLIYLFFIALVYGCSSASIHGSGGPYKKGASAHSKPYKINGNTYRPIASSRGFSQKGLASWYGKKFHGRKTSNGETYNMYAMTAAHKTLPLGTWVRVHNLENKRQAVVRVNDRGPFVRGRIIDLSYKAAKKLGVLGPGTAKVKVVALGRAASGVRGKAIPKKFKSVNYWNGNFTVQVGAFKVKNNARRLKSQLIASFGNAHIKSYSDYRGRFYRVRVGRFKNLKKANAFAKKMMTMGNKQAFVVAE